MEFGWQMIQVVHTVHLVVLQWTKIKEFNYGSET